MAEITCPQCSGDDVYDINEVSSLLSDSVDTSKQWICGRCGHTFNAEVTHWYDAEDFSELTISQLASIVISDWGGEISPQAYPYLEAMEQLESMDDSVGYDSAASIIAYFLSNDKSWKTPTASRVKEELNARLNNE